MDVTVIKEYLVGLGFAVNQPELSKFEAGIHKAGAAVEASTSGIVKSLLKWQVEATAAFVAVSSAVIGLADHVAMADQEYRLFGLRMFLTTENARKLKMGMDALGASMEEIAWDPETRKRFLELSDLQDSLTGSLGPDFEDNMRKVRDLRFEFTKLKIELQYLSFGFINELFKALGTNVDGVKAKLEEWIGSLRDNMPAITIWLKDFFVPILRDTWDILKQTGQELKVFGNLFADLVNIFAQDEALDDSVGTFQRIANAVQIVIKAIALLTETIALVIGSIGHFARAVVSDVQMVIHEMEALITGDWSKVQKDADKSWSEEKKGAADLVAAAGSGIIETISPGTNDKLAEVSPEIKPLLNTLRRQIGSSASARSLPALGGSSSDMASEARAQAIKTGAELGINPNLIFEQWQHESGNFTSPVAKGKNNLGGIRLPGSLEYRQFDSVADYAQFYTGLLRNKRYTSQGILGAQTEEQFAGALKRGGYYEDSYDNYVSGMKRFGRQNGDISLNQPSGGTQQITVDVGGIHITEPGANAEQIQQATTRGITRALAKQTQRNLAQLPYAG